MIKNLENNDEKYSLYIIEGIKNVNYNNFHKAEILFKEAININSKKHESYINLANIYVLQKKYEKTYELLFDYLFNHNFNEHIANHIGKILFNYKELNKLEELFILIKLNDSNYQKEKKFLFFIQGKYYEYLNKYNEAIKSYLNSTKCDKFFFESYKELLNLYETTNDIQELEKLLDVIQDLFKDKEKINVIKFYKSMLLNRNKKFLLSQEYIFKNNLHKSFNNDKNFKIKLLDLQSKNYEKLKNFSSAFKSIEERNSIILNQEKNKKYNKNNILDAITKYKEFYIKKNISLINNRLKYKSDEKLVFLVGFPRSGTTLLDTILRSHSKIKVIEEKPYLLNLRHEYLKKKNNNLESILNITQIQKDEIRDKYYKKIISHEGDNEKIIVDKFPLSLIELGFIKCIFPNSKIILAVRHPCDVVTSCFFSYFKINDAMINFLKIEDTINFYNKVLDLFEFYEGELDLNYILIKYEEIVHNFSNNINLLLEFLDLPYENQLENFYMTAKKREKISTPSYNQVINPLYTSSIDRWKNYNQIQSHKKNLDRWIKKFKY